MQIELDMKLVDPKNKKMYDSNSNFKNPVFYSKRRLGKK